MRYNFTMIFGGMLLILGAVAPAYANCSLCENDVEAYKKCSKAQLICTKRVIMCMEGSQKMNEKLCWGAMDKCMLKAGNICK